jgi:hypothetical protein
MLPRREHLPHQSIQPPAIIEQLEISRALDYPIRLLLPSKATHRLSGCQCGSSSRISTNGRSWVRSNASGRLRQRRVVNRIIAALLRPLGFLCPLSVPPGARIAQLAALLTLARPTERLGKVLRGDLCQQLGLVSAAQDVDLGAGDGVEELLDDAEDAGEAPGRVDDVHLTQTLRVVVLADLGHGAKVAVDGAGLADADALQVHDCARGLEEVAGFAGAGGEAGVGHLFVFADEVLNHAFLRGDLSEGGEVDIAELLDVEWAAILLVSEVLFRGQACERLYWVLREAETYLVGLVVVLGVELEHLGPLLVVEGADQLLDADASVLAPPLLAVDEPENCQSMPQILYTACDTYICFASSTLNFRARRNRSCDYLAPARCSLFSTTRAYQCQGVEVLGVARRLQGAAQLEDLGILLRRCVSRVSALNGRSNGRIVVVVVLGVELQLVGGCSSHCVLMCGEDRGREKQVL